MQLAAGMAVLNTGTLDDQVAARLLYQRIIVLGAEVDDQVANRLCGQLLLLSAEDPRSDISLYINSPGGSVSTGLAIYDTMCLIPNDVSTLAMGLAGSMGQEEARAYGLIDHVLDRVQDVRPAPGFRRQLKGCPPRDGRGPHHRRAREVHIHGLRFNYPVSFRAW